MPGAGPGGAAGRPLLPLHGGSACSLSPAVPSASPGASSRPLQWTSSLPRRNNRRRPGEWNFYERTESCYDLTALSWGGGAGEGGQGRKELVRTQSGLIVPPRRRKGAGGRPGGLGRSQSGLLVPPRRKRSGSREGGEGPATKGGKEPGRRDAPEVDESESGEAPRAPPTPPPRRKLLQRASYSKLLAAGRRLTPRDSEHGTVQCSAVQCTAVEGGPVGEGVGLAGGADTFWQLIHSSLALNSFLPSPAGDPAREGSRPDMLGLPTKGDLGRRAGSPEEWATPRESWVSASDGYTECPRGVRGAACTGLGTGASHQVWPTQPAVIRSLGCSLQLLV
jgi:hypothetical protein